ncbi:hypothetical protein, partial [Escherichia coli]|uniref:hypothetical protein n=1 Tax=Escherichia coli TaxID=562 RepID=UPI001BFD671C
MKRCKHLTVSYNCPIYNSIRIQEQCIISDDLLTFFECPVADALGNAVSFEIDDGPPFSVRTVHAHSFTSPFSAHL